MTIEPPQQWQWLIRNVATLGFAVAFGAVLALIGGIGARVFLRVGGRGAGSGQEQGRAGGQQQGVGAQAFHAAKVRPGGLKLKVLARIFIKPAWILPWAKELKVRVKSSVG